MGIGERIKRQRQSLEMTQVELAATVGRKARREVAQALVSRWEAGADPSARYISPIAAALGVEVQWLLTGRAPRLRA